MFLLNALRVCIHFNVVHLIHIHIYIYVYKDKPFREVLYVVENVICSITCVDIESRWSVRKIQKFTLFIILSSNIRDYTSA